MENNQVCKTRRQYKRKNEQTIQLELPSKSKKDKTQTKTTKKSKNSTTKNQKRKNSKQDQDAHKQIQKKVKTEQQNQKAEDQKQEQNNPEYQEFITKKKDIIEQIQKIKSKKAIPDQNQLEKWTQILQQFSKVELTREWMPFDQRLCTQLPPNKQLSSELLSLSKCLLDQLEIMLFKNKKQSIVSKFWLNLFYIQKKENIHPTAMTLFFKILNMIPNEHNLQVVFQIGKKSFQKPPEYQTITIKPENEDQKQGNIQIQQHVVQYPFFDQLKELNSLSNLGIMIYPDIKINQHFLANLLSSLDHMTNLQRLTLHFDENFELNSKSIQNLGQFLKSHPNILKISIKFTEIQSFNQDIFQNLLKHIFCHPRTMVSLQLRETYALEMQDIKLLFQLINDPKQKFLKNLQLEMNQSTYFQQSENVNKYFQKELQNMLINKPFFLGIDSKNLKRSQNNLTLMAHKKYNSKRFLELLIGLKQSRTLYKFRKEVFWEMFQLYKASII